MSSDDGYIQSLAQAQKNIFKFGGPILMVIGMASCTMSLMVFLRKNLRKSSCSIYLVAYNSSNLLLICTTLFFSILATGYNIDPGLYNLHFCRFRMYAIFLFDILGPTYLILASIDRILFTSPNARTRQRSTPRLACICVAISTVLWSLAHVHSLVLSEITEPAPDYIRCYLQIGPYVAVMGYYLLIFKGILVPLLMIILGLWAVKNVRRLARVPPTVSKRTTETTSVQSAHARHSKDRQLLKMLLIDISLYIFFNMMMVVVLMYQQFDQTLTNNIVELWRQTLLLTVSLYSSFIPFCIGCYTNLLVSKTFRQEVKNILMWK